MQGHTSSIFATKFMPHSGNEQIITSAADRQVCSPDLRSWHKLIHILVRPDADCCLQIRHVNLQKNAIKPYSCHNGRVKALMALDASMSTSAQFGLDVGNCLLIMLHSSCNVWLVHL